RPAWWARRRRFRACWGGGGPSVVSWLGAAGVGVRTRGPVGQDASRVGSMRALTTADVARRPAPGTTVPTSLRFSPDGRVVTHLLAEAGSLHQSLFAVDVATGTSRQVPTPGGVVDEATLGLEERLRRERAREL